MTIFCSNLPNDQDMIKALGSMSTPLPSLFTDCCFSGSDDNGSSLLVAVERKKIGDLTQCITDGRLLFQFQRCKEAGADVLCLVAEGRYRRNPDDGLLEIPTWGINPRTMKRAEVWTPVKPTMAFSRFDQYLTEIEYLAGVIVKHSEHVQGTADVILSLYANFQTPPSDHQSMKQMFKPPAPVIQLVRPNLVRRVASELPRIGWEWSGAVAGRFGSVREMASAKVTDWAKLELEKNGKSRKLGRKAAEEIMKALGEKHGN